MPIDFGLVWFGKLAYEIKCRVKEKTTKLWQNCFFFVPPM
jgi:hypothetical protein